jgi:acyl-CoA synthetase (AMP-forming)/AMP-acid ligase II
MDGMTVGYIAERNARKWPDTEAVVEQSPDGRLAAHTFAEFNERADRLANGLAEHGVGQGDAVALYMKNNAETLEAFVGIMKIGALPVPVNHRFKGEEVKYVLADSDARVCLVDAFGAETLAEIRDDPETPVELALYAGEEPPAFATGYESFLSAADDTPVDIVPDRSDEAGLMYTSGTTGKPKGCIYTHDNLVQLTQEASYEWEHFEPGNRHLLTTPLFHVGAFVPFLNNFHTAGTAVVVDGFDPQWLLELVEQEEVNSTYLVPTQGRMVLDVEEFGEYDLSTLTDISMGGAPVGAELKRELMERIDCGVTESFGQTEALSLILSPEMGLEKPDSVGRPTLNFEAKVVDPETGERLPPGEAGLIAYNGPTVFDRYHNMPERTAEAFDEDGWFVSGDLVRMDEDGYFYFLGRSDDMIITGGENVHPAEIEDVLYGHPEVSEVAIVGVPDEQWGERIKACIVLEEGAALGEQDVTDYVGERLAGYKKPREIQFYDELPRNPTGKVLRDQLS